MVDEGQREQAVQQFADALVAFGQALAALEAVGLEPAAALRLIPGQNGGASLYDEMPLQVRMLIG